MTATAQDFTLYAGDDATLTVTVTESGSAKNLVGASVTWVLYDRFSRAAVLTKTTDDDVTITNGAGGILTVDIASADTSALNGAYYHECKVTDSDGNISTVSTGTVTIRRGYAEA